MGSVASPNTCDPSRISDASRYTAGFCGSRGTAQNGQRQPCGSSSKTAAVSLQCSHCRKYPCALQLLHPNLCSAAETCTGAAHCGHGKTVATTTCFGP